MWFYVAAATVACLVQASAGQTSSQPGPICPGDKYYVTDEGKCLSLFTSPVTRDQAQANCSALGGNLTSINSPVENTDAVKLLDYYCSDAFIGWEYSAGCTDRGQGSWIDGSNLTYSNFSSDYSISSCKSTDFVDTYLSASDGAWHHACNVSMPYICEKPITCPSNFKAVGKSCVKLLTNPTNRAYAAAACNLAAPGAQVYRFDDTRQHITDILTALGKPPSNYTEQDYWVDADPVAAYWVYSSDGTVVPGYPSPSCIAPASNCIRAVIHPMYNYVPTALYYMWQHWTCTDQLYIICEYSQ